MKDFEYYNSLPYSPVVLPDNSEGGYTAYYPDLPGCITCSDTLEGVLAEIEDAKRVWIEAALEDGVLINEPFNHANQ